MKIKFEVKELMFPANKYDIYNMDEKELKPFLTWRMGNSILNADEKWIVKECDFLTTNHLYGKNLNPVSIMIFKTYSEMVAHVHSIDDSSYMIWTKKLPLDTLYNMRTELMKYVDSQLVLSGSEFLNKAVELGFDKNTIQFD